MYPTDSGVFIEVWDRNPKSPVRQEQDSSAESGRGLLIVETLSARWNVYFPKFGGKIVWCEVETP